MATLHTVNKSPFATRSLQSCMAHARDGDAIILIEDGVYGATRGTALADAVAACMETVQVFALGPDLAARGIGTGGLIEGVKRVDYTGYVELAAGHDLTNAWL